MKYANDDDKHEGENEKNSDKKDTLMTNTLPLIRLSDLYKQETSIFEILKLTRGGITATAIFRLDRTL